MRKTHLLVALVLAIAAAWAHPARAKDVFYFLGYGSIEVIDGDTDAIVGKIPVPGFLRESVISADQKSLYVTASRHVIQRVSLSDNKVVSKVDVNGDGWQRFIFGFALAADEKSAYVGLFSRRTDGGEVIIGAPVVAQISLESGTILRSIEVPFGVARLMLVKEGRSIYAMGKDLYEIDVSGPQLKVVSTFPMFEKQWNFLPFWEYAAESGGLSVMNYYTPERMGLLMVETRTGELTDIPLAGDPVLAYSVILSPDRKKAYAVMDDLSVIDMTKKGYGPAVPIGEGTSYAVNVSSDGKKIYVGGGGSTVTVFDARTLKPRKVLKMATDGMDLRRISF